MSRKDYIAFAEMIADEMKVSADDKRERDMLHRLSRGMAQIFARDNARFDVDRFMSACGF